MDSTSSAHRQICEEWVGSLADQFPADLEFLTVPNWSVGRERVVVRRIRDLADSSEVTLHFCEADIDHNRTVTGFSGNWKSVLALLGEIAFEVMDACNLQRHVGVHPRIGALDVCPFVALPGRSESSDLIPLASAFSEWLAATFDVPVFLYEKSARQDAKKRLPTLRKGGFGALLDVELSPDFGPVHVHPHRGASVVGVRDFLIACNVNFHSSNLVAVQRIAKEIRDRRKFQMADYGGVRALGFPLASREMVQVSLNFTSPDSHPCDPVLRWILETAEAAGLGEGTTELIGVIRDIDLPGATLLHPSANQVVPWA